MNDNCAWVILVILVIGLVSFPEMSRKRKIKSHTDWGWAFSRAVTKKEIRLDMNKEMVLLSWGNPSSVDSIEITQDGRSERWVYGKKRNKAKYVYFSKGKVYKIFYS